jgi:hypothetical protein
MSNTTFTGLKEEYIIDLIDFPSTSMIISKILYFLKNNKKFIEILKEYSIDKNKIYIFDEANITYDNSSLNNFINNKIINEANILSIIISNKLTKEDSRKYMKKTKNLPFQLIIKKKNNKTNNVKIYMKIKTFSDIPIEKRLDIFKKLYNKYHELDDILLLSIYNNLIKYSPKLYSNDKYKKVKYVNKFELI